MSSSATSAEVGFDARTACASLIACCATAVALSRIDCGSEGFALTSVSNERAVCRRTTAEAKDIQFRNEAYKALTELYHVFRLPPILRPPPPPCYHSRRPPLRGKIAAAICRTPTTLLVIVAITALSLSFFVPGILRASLGILCMLCSYVLLQRAIAKSVEDHPLSK